jgi:hypothetical protein
MVSLKFVNLRPPASVPTPGLGLEAHAFGNLKGRDDTSLNLLPAISVMA